MTIYFDKKKEAYGFKIENAIAEVEDDVWSIFCVDEVGTTWDIINGNFVDLRDTEKYKKQIETKRKEAFKSQFFEIKGFGWYRKQPKGYGSAIESLNTAFNVVGVTGGLPANTLTFYSEPDFSIEEQCTEEWLVANSFKNNQMTVEEFGIFFANFVTAWNNEEHK